MQAWWQSQALAQAHSLPARLYVDPAMAVVEQAQVFGPSWQLLAHAAQLADPGDVLPVDMLGLPLLLLRDRSGVLRALHNVCRHRGGPLATECLRGQTRLRCRYHGWSYALDGALLAGPELDAIEGLQPETLRLPAIAVTEWQGLVFAAIEPAYSFSSLVEGLDARLAAAALPALRFQRRVSYHADCNWKAYVDNYLEGYHLPHVHPALNRLLDYRRYRTELAGWHSLQSSPLDASNNFYAGDEALYVFLWPNTMLNVLPGRLQTNRVLPLGAERCRIDFDYYYAADLDAEALDQVGKDQALADQTQAEDLEICEQIQRAYRSACFDQGRVHPTRETGIHHFQELYRRAMAAACSP